MRSLLGAVFAFIFVSLQRGDATRYLPSIVWDHLNPILSCKCNWFNPMTMMEIYDRFEFVCPTPKITVLLLDSYSRPADQMNVNLFQRKWKGGKSKESINELRKQMMTGEFCDPESNETQRIYQCKNGEDGKGKAIRFARDTNFYKDEIVVFFNNGNDGRASTLTSKEKNCAMALVAQVTWGVAEKYDFTYAKNLTADTERCKNVMCDVETPSPIPNKTISQPTSTVAPRIKSTAPSQIVSTAPCQITTTTRVCVVTTTVAPHINNNVTIENRPNSNSTKQSCTDDEPSTSKRSSSESWDNFKYGALVGCGVTLLVVFFVAGSCYIMCRKSRSKGRKTNCVCHYKTGDGCQSTIVNELGSEREAGALPAKTPFPQTSQGVNNKAYQTRTLERGSGRA